MVCFAHFICCLRGSLAQASTELAAFLSKVSADSLTVVSVNPFPVHIRALFALITHAVRKLLGKTPPSGNSGLQRMCPFCGLITSRHKTSCMECGRMLRAA